MANMQTTHTIYRDAERFFDEWSNHYVARADDLLLGIDGQPWPERLLVTRKGRVVAGGVLARGVPFRTHDVVYTDPGSRAVVVQIDARERVL